MAGPIFPITVSSEQQEIVEKGNQSVAQTVDDFSESHRGATIRNALPNPNDMFLWRDGNLRFDE